MYLYKTVIGNINVLKLPIMYVTMNFIDCILIMKRGTVNGVEEF